VVSAECVWENPQGWKNCWGFGAWCHAAWRSPRMCGVAAGNPACVDRCKGILGTPRACGGCTVPLGKSPGLEALLGVWSLVPCRMALDVRVRRRRRQSWMCGQGYGYPRHTQGMWWVHSASWINPRAGGSAGGLVPGPMLHGARRACPASPPAIMDVWTGVWVC
jgi:hypothetical protein